MTREEFLSGKPFKKITGKYTFRTSSNGEIYATDPCVAAPQHSFKIISDTQFELSAESIFYPGKIYIEVVNFSDYELSDKEINP